MTKVVNLEYGEKCQEDFDIRTAMEEASRCLLCEDAPCSKGCPAMTDPGKFIRSLRFKNVKGAAETIRENNILGACCALVCPYDKLCEEACARTGIDKPIQIGKLQKFAIDNEKLFDMEILEVPAEKKDKKIACIGSGPASLACSARLAREGYNVTIFEEKEKPGGVLTYGITPSRLPQDVVDYDISKVKDLGVEFVMNKKITLDDIDDLKKEFDAIFVGVGLSASKTLDIKGSDYEGVIGALDFLADARSNNGNIEIGENVVVIGLGDVALDCATTAHQISDGKVTIVYRRSIEEAPANVDELDYAQSMGIPVVCEFSPEEIIGEDEKVQAISFKSRDGFSTMTLKADQVIFALGQKPKDGFENLAEEDFIFKAGDLVNGGDTVVEAVKEGKEKAEEILEFLGE